MSTETRSALQNPIVWIGGLVLVAAIVAGAIALSGGDDEVVTDGGTDTAPAVIFETGPVQVSGAYLDRLANPDPAVGTPAPRISGISFDGEAISVGGDGRPRLYGFFAHWCPHCQDELPRVAEWLRSNDPPGDVDLVAISTGVSSDAPNYPPSEWFEREEWPDDVIADSEDSTIGQAFGLTGYPFWVGTNSAGEVEFRAGGSLSDDQLVALMDLLAES